MITMWMKKQHCSNSHLKLSSMRPCKLCKYHSLVPISVTMWMKKNNIVLILIWHWAQSRVRPNSMNIIRLCTLFSCRITSPLTTSFPCVTSDLDSPEQQALTGWKYTISGFVLILILVSPTEKDWKSQPVLKETRWHQLIVHVYDFTANLVEKRRFGPPA